MPLQQPASVLLYGNSLSLEMIESKLRRAAQFDVIRIDSRQTVAAQQLPNLRASILVYDQKYTDTDLVSAFMLKNPHTPVISLGSQSERAELLAGHLSSQHEILGLAQVLQMLCKPPASVLTDQ